MQPELSDAQKQEAKKWVGFGLLGKILSVALSASFVAYVLLADRPYNNIAIATSFAGLVASRLWLSYCVRRIKRIETSG